MSLIFLREYTLQQSMWSMTTKDRDDIKFSGSAPYVDEFVISCRPAMARINAALPPVSAATYDIHVTTGSFPGSGTDADVFCALIGAEGETKEVLLDNPWKDDHERGKVSKFIIGPLPYVGDLVGIRLRRAVSFLDKIVIPSISGVTPEVGNGNDWYVTSVVVSAVDAESDPRRILTSWIFPCNEWLTRKRPSTLLLAGNESLVRAKNNAMKSIASEILAERKDMYQYMHEHPQLGNVKGLFLHCAKMPQCFRLKSILTSRLGILQRRQSTWSQMPD